jgi:hypothetical protein
MHRARDEALGLDAHLDVAGRESVEGERAVVVGRFERRRDLADLRVDERLHRLAVGIDDASRESRRGGQLHVAPVVQRGAGRVELPLDLDAAGHRERHVLRARRHADAEYVVIEVRLGDPSVDPRVHAADACDAGRPEQAAADLG